MAMIDIPSLFRDVLETPQQRQQRQMQEGMLRGQQMTSRLGGLAATQAPLIQTLYRNMPARQDALRRGVGGMLGLDVRTESEKLSDILKTADTSSPSGMVNLSKAIQEYAPAQALQLRQAAVEEQRLIEDRQTAERERLRRASLEQSQAERAETQLDITQQQLDATLQRLDLEIENREYQRDQDRIRNERLQKQLDLERERFKAAEGELSVTAQKFQNELFGEYEGAVTLADRASRTADMFANTEIRGQGRSGFAGRARDQLSRLLGSDDPLLLDRVALNSIRNDVAIRSLPKGPASDRDIALVLEGTIDQYSNPAQIESYLRGVAKMQAIIAEQKRQRIEYIGENKGTQTGFIEEWTKMQNGQESDLHSFAEGQEFESYMVEQYDIRWNFDEEREQEEADEEEDNEDILNDIVSRGPTQTTQTTRRRRRN